MGAVFAPRPSNVIVPLVGDTVVSAATLAAAGRDPEPGTAVDAAKAAGAVAGITICFSFACTLALGALGSWAKIVRTPHCILFKQLIGLLRRMASYLVILICAATWLAMSSI